MKQNSESGVDRDVNSIHSCVKKSCQLEVLDTELQLLSSPGNLEMNKLITKASALSGRMRCTGHPQRSLLWPLHCLSLAYQALQYGC